MPRRDLSAPERSVRDVGEAVLRARTALANTHVSMELARQPDSDEQQTQLTRNQSLEDSHHQLSCLAAALIADNPELFVDYAGWAKVTQSNRDPVSADIAANLRCLCDALRFELSPESADVAIGFVRYAIERLPSLPTDTSSFVGPGHPHALLARMYLQALCSRDLKAARRFVLGAIEGGISVRDVYLNVLQPTLYEIGRLWQTNQIDVACEHFSTAATQSIMSLLNQLGVPDHEKTGKIIVTTCVAGNQHELGVRMVADFFEMAGWDSYYLGANTPTDSVISELIERKADVLGVSATMVSDVPVLADLIRSVRRTDECQDVKILVGGHPFRLDQKLWLTVNADGGASDAELAVEEARRWFDA